MDDFSLLMKTWWPLFWAFVISGIQIIQMLLSKTYARKEDVQQVKSNIENVAKDVQLLEIKVDAMPTQTQITDLLVALENTNGRIESLGEKIKPIENLSRLLLEQRLKDDN